MAVYKGFSFKKWGFDKSFVLTDVDLVKQDLLNHILTVRGERVEQRGFGTTIDNQLFEPYDDNTVTRITDQVREVIDFDPRVILINDDDFNVFRYPDEGRLVITALLFYVELNLTDRFDLNLEFES